MFFILDLQSFYFLLTLNSVVLSTNLSQHCGPLGLHGAVDSRSHWLVCWAVEVAEITRQPNWQCADVKNWARPHRFSVPTLLCGEFFATSQSKKFVSSWFKFETLFMIFFPLRHYFLLCQIEMNVGILPDLEIMLGSFLKLNLLDPIQKYHFSPSFWKIHPCTGIELRYVSRNVLLSTVSSQ